MIELILYSNLPGIQAQIERYGQMAVLAPSHADQVRRLIESERPPQVLYLDDTRPLPLNELWSLVTAAQRRQMRVFVNLYGPARAIAGDLREAGVPLISERQPAAVAAWIAESLGVALRPAGSRAAMIAVGAAKGGIGKTLVTATLAEGLRRRGLRVLVWDSDISNPGIVSAFRIPASAPSYLHLVERGVRAWSAEMVAPFVYKPEHTRGSAAGWGPVDFLIGSHAATRAENDLRLNDWQQLYEAVQALEGYDVVIADTSPDYLKRPYPTHVLQMGGYVVLPAPPGSRERLGVGNMLDHLREFVGDRLASCFMVFMEPERGVAVTVKDVAPMFAERYPEVRVLGTLPRMPRLASIADEQSDYCSILDLAPSGAFARATHSIIETLCTRLALSPSLDAPRLHPWQRLMGSIRRDRVQMPPPAAQSHGTGVQP